MALPLIDQIRAAGLPAPEPEFRFAPPRRWRFDLCWAAPFLVAYEREGGVWTGGRHTRPKGYKNDMEKYNEAALRGWCLIRCTPQQEADGTALALVERALRARGWNGKGEG